MTCTVHSDFRVGDEVGRRTAQDERFDDKEAGGQGGKLIHHAGGDVAGGPNSVEVIVRSLTRPCF